MEKVPFWKKELFWFLVFTFIVSGVTILRMEHANDILRESHSKIIDQNKNCQQLTESILSIHTQLEYDTTLSRQERKSLLLALEELSKKTDRSDYEGKINDLIELEFTKIQNEYEVLNLWCALLTVVFLIFSFFSIFKTNEMSRQGEEALKNLRDTAKEAKDKSDSIDEKVHEAEDRIIKREGELTGTLNENIAELRKKADEQAEKLKTLDDAIKTATERHEEIRANQTTILTQVDDHINEIQKTLASTIRDTVNSEIKVFLNDKEQSIQELALGLKSLEKEIRVLYSKIENTDTETVSGESSNTAEPEDMDHPEDEPQE